MDPNLDSTIGALTTEVTNATTVEASATAFVNGVPGLITAAVDKAVAAGATKAQLQAITDLATALKAKSSQLSDAITANTPHA
jgi:hypothetical protein